MVPTDALKGKTSVLPRFDAKGHRYVCIASSMCQTDDTFFRIRDSSFKGEGIVNCLQGLLAHTPRKILLLGDHARWHKSDETSAFLHSKEGGRLWVAPTPPYSPELNPDERVWASLKRVQLPNRVAKNSRALKQMAQEAMTTSQNSVELVKSYFNFQITALRNSNVDIKVCF